MASPHIRYRGEKGLHQELGDLVPQNLSISSTQDARPDRPHWTSFVNVPCAMTRLVCADKFNQYNSVKFTVGFIVRMSWGQHSPHLKKFILCRPGSGGLSHDHKE